MEIGQKWITGVDIYHAFLNGAERIIFNKSDLNKINVFPVADGDTGTNLASTMRRIINDATCDKRVDVTLASISEASLIGARGNSGIIFAQFFQGLYDKLKGKARISKVEFAEAAGVSVDFAYLAVSTPVEGTMLTVIKAWATSLKKLAAKDITFREMFEKALEEANVALEKTKDRLEVLKKANVVDSGGKGFVDFLEGVFGFFKNGKRIIQKRKLEFEEEQIHDIASSVKERYCTEAFIEGENLDREDIRTLIKDLGNSLIVVTRDNKARIHIHTNRPQEVFYRLKNIATIVSQKIDDMKRQYEVVNERKYKIALVTDSIADISTKLIEKYQIQVVPISLMIEGNEFYDKLTITHQHFYEMADRAKTFPTSSLPSVKRLEHVFSFLSTHYDSIIGVFVSSKLSGTYQNAVSASKKLKEEGYRIDIIDSKLNSGAQGLLVLEAAKMIENENNHEKIVSSIEEIRSRFKILVSVDDFSYMVRGGRVSERKGKIAKILNLKPIVTLDKEGKGTFFKKAFSRRSNIKKIVNKIKETDEKKGIEEFCVVHAKSPHRARKIAKKIEALKGSRRAYTCEVSCVVGISAGKGAVAVAYMEGE